MSYHALARKYRPSTFAEMIGQKHVVTTLRAALRKNKLSHAYLFSGPRGTGKTTVARLLAKALNCSDLQQDDPCGKCDSCRGIAGSSYLDVLEIDAASNTGVDNIRDLRDMAQYTPTKGKCRVFIIDEVHMLSKGAFNALLKILEEPPASVYFFFATTEVTKIPRTILSRCQRFDFRLLTREEISGRVKQIAKDEKVKLADSGLRMVISLAEGSMRDALSTLDQLIAASEGKIDEEFIVELFGLVRSEIYVELNEAIIAHDSKQALRLIDKLLQTGQSLDVFAQGVMLNFRNLLLLKIDPELTSALDLSPELIETYMRQAAQFSERDLLALIDRAGLHYERIHRSTQPRILLEAALVEYTLFESRVLLSDLVRRLSDLSGADLTGGPAARGPNPQAAGAPPSRASEAGPNTPTGRSAPARSARVNGSATGSSLAETLSHSAAAAAETVPGWTSFIQALMQSHPGLASCLMEGLPSLDDDRNRLLIAFPQDKAFQMQRLAQEQAVIEERMAASWGSQLRLKLMTTSQPDAGDLPESVRREVAPTEDESLQAACQDDQPLADLVDLLQGEVVPDQERRDWLRRSDFGRSQATESRQAERAQSEPETDIS